jgi:hypothetical protein
VEARYSATIQTGSGAHPAFCKMGTKFFSPGTKGPRHGVDYPNSFNAEVKERVEIYFYSSLGISWPVLG